MHAVALIVIIAAALSLSANRPRLEKRLAAFPGASAVARRQRPRCGKFFGAGADESRQARGFLDSGDAILHDRKSRGGSLDVT